MSELQPLVDKTVIFYSPYHSKEVLVRTGVVEDKNSLIQCILLATDRQYLKYKDQRETMYNDVCTKIYSMNSLKNRITKVLSECYDLILKGEKLKYKFLKRDKDVYSIVFEILSYADFAKVLKVNSSNIKVYKEQVNDDLKQLVLGCFGDLNVEKERKDHCVSKILGLFSNICDYCIKFELSTENIFDHYSDINAIILNPETKRPINQPNIKKGNYIILIRFENDRYEIVGKLLRDNVIKRIFNQDDEIIKFNRYEPKEKEVQQKTVREEPGVTRRGETDTKPKEHRKSVRRMERVSEEDENNENTKRKQWTEEDLLDSDNNEGNRFILDR